MFQNIFSCRHSATTTYSFPVLQPEEPPGTPSDTASSEYPVEPSPASIQRHLRTPNCMEKSIVSTVTQIEVPITVHDRHSRLPSWHDDRHRLIFIMITKRMYKARVPGKILKLRQHEDFGAFLLPSAKNNA